MGSRRTFGLILIFALLNASGCRQEYKDSAFNVDFSDLDLIRNDALPWDADLRGIFPRPWSNVAADVQSRPEMWLPMLMTCLHDPDRFAAAHAYLKLIQGELLPASSEEWQGLHVEVLPDGGGKYDPSDQEKLLREWKEWRQLRGLWSSFNE